MAALFVLITVLPGCTESEQGVALGTLERDRIALTATAAEIITAQPVAEGGRVEAGQLLTQLDTRLQTLVLKQLEAELAQSEAFFKLLRNGPRREEITGAEARVDVVTATLHENELQLARVQDLVNRQVESQSELDRISATLNSNRARLRDAEAQLQLLRSGSRTEELAQAQAQLQATRARLAYEQQKLSDFAIVATRSGTLDSLPFHVGERVSIGAEVAVILSDDAPYARIHVPQTKRAMITPGTTLTVHIDGSVESFTGQVRWIAQEPAFTPYYALNSSERSRLVYLAEVQLPAAAANLPSGLPVQVELPQ